MDFAGINIVDINEEQPDYGRWLILGPPGGGKTTLAATIAELGKTLFIDLAGEKGTRSFPTPAESTSSAPTRSPPSTTSSGHSTRATTTTRPSSSTR